MNLVQLNDFPIDVVTRSITKYENIQFLNIISSIE